MINKKKKKITEEENVFRKIESPFPWPDPPMEPEPPLAEEEEKEEKDETAEGEIA